MDDQKRKVDGLSFHKELTICNYATNVFIGIFCRLIVAIIVAAFFTGILIVVFSILYLWFYVIGHYIFDMQSFDDNLLNISTALNIAIGSILIVFGFVFVVFQYVSKERSESHSFLSTYIKSKKNKVCTFISLED